MSNVSHVLSHYPVLGDIREVKSLGGGGGFSGSRLWCVTAAAGCFCLRQWPAEHPTPERLRLIHGVLQQAGRHLPFIPVPLPVARSTSTLLEDRGGRSELTPWMPGVADYHAHPNRPRLTAAFQALAKFHQATADFGGPRHPAPAPAIAERRERLHHLQHIQYDQIAHAVRRGLSPVLDDCGNHLLRRFPALAPPLAAELASAATIPLRLQPAIRDVWHDHVLFTGDEVTGIVDFGALRIDTPLTDIARLLGSLAADDPAARDHALAAYDALQPLSDQDRRLIALLDQSGTLLAGFNWLAWLYLDRRHFDDLPAVTRRLQSLVHRLRG